MNPTCVDSVLQDLCEFETHSRSVDFVILSLQMDFRFLKIYLWCLAKWNAALLRKNKHFIRSHIKATLGNAGNGLYTACIRALEERRFGDWNAVAFSLTKRIHNCMPRIKQGSLHWLNSSFQCNFSSDELHEFMELIGISLQKLVIIANRRNIVDKEEIESLRQTFILFVKIFSFARERCRSEKELNALRIHLQVWAYEAACLSLLYWLAKVEYGVENNELRLNILLSDLLQKIRPPCNREVTGLCLRVLKASEPSPSPSERFRAGELVFNLLVFLLENLDSPLKGSVGILQSGLLFLITIFMDPSITKKHGEDDKILLTEEHEEDEKCSSTAGNDESILTPVALADAALDEAQHLIYSLHDGEFNEEIAHRKLQSFGDKINKVKAEIRKIRAPVLLASSFCFPRTNVVGFTKLVLKNLEEILKSELQLSPSAKHKIEIVHKELQSLRTSLKDFIKQQNEQDQLKDIWTQIFNIPYLVDLAIKSFLYLDSSQGYEMLCPCLSDVIEEIRFIRCEIKKVQGQEIDKFGQLKPAMLSSSPMPSAKDSTSIDDDFVGFNDEVKDIIELLKSDSEQLGIICIYGMPGQGKTTLANKLYNHPLVQLRFHKRAWCCVSQDFEPKKVLLEILSHLIRDTGDISRNEVEDLEDKLSKCLKGQKYLIVLDDIWDIKAWKALENSFPNESRGSKILFTSRVDLTAQCQIDCTPHPLRPLSEVESWELLQKKIIAISKHRPQSLPNVGVKIAKKCKGLPLTIVLIAGLLADNAENLEWWNYIEGQVGFEIVSEGCKHILELSYKHLPEYLKSCFLYFGSFPEDKVIRVSRLIQLWISERLIQKPAMKRFEPVAKEYLMDLVKRSLVIVTGRSSTGGIKQCRVHDLLREFCLAKGKEENFLHVMNMNDVSRYSWDDMYKHYRFCIHGERCWYPDPSPFVHSLLFCGTFGGILDKLDCFPWHKYKLLQVLELEKIWFSDCIPEEITMLVLLRHLAIWCNNVHLRIPRSVAKLVNLECIRVLGRSLLIVSDGYYPYSVSDEISSAIWSMKKLRYVDIDAQSLYCDDAESCLDNVQIFKTVHLAHPGFAKKLLRRIPHVRKLSCHIKIDPGQKDIDQMPSLDLLSQLESLCIHSFEGSKNSFESILPSSLRKLTLRWTSLEWSAISTIAKMRNLEVLKLLIGSFLGEEWDVKGDEFLGIKFLKLSGLNLERWNASDDAFPCLERLVVEDCYELEEIPSRFGWILGLKMIEIFSCRSTVRDSARHVQEQQLDFGNEELQVVITA